MGLLLASAHVLMKHLEDRVVKRTGRAVTFSPVSSCSFGALIDDEWINQSALDAPYSVPCQSLWLNKRSLRLDFRYRVPIDSTGIEEPESTLPTVSALF